jgi:hypothetical protein
MTRRRGRWFVQLTQRTNDASHAATTARTLRRTAIHRQLLDEQNAKTMATRRCGVGLRRSAKRRQVTEACLGGTSRKRVRRDSNPQPLVPKVASIRSRHTRCGYPIFRASLYLRHNSRWFRLTYDFADFTGFGAVFQRFRTEFRTAARALVFWVQNSPAGGSHHNVASAAASAGSRAWMTFMASSASFV